MSRSVPLRWFAGATATGLLAGWFLARRHDRLHRNDLFSRQPYRRFAALGWLEAECDPAARSLLHDYLAWESIPALRTRARRVITALDAKHA